LLLGVGLTTVGWVGVTLATAPTDEATLDAFYRLTRPGGPGWRRIARRVGAAETRPGAAAGSGLGVGLLSTLVASLAVYSALFATGIWLYGRHAAAAALGIAAVAGGLATVALWRRIDFTQ
jgi:hypothetical protein